MTKKNTVMKEFIGWKATTWSITYVFDKFQSTFINKMNPNSQTLISDYIHDRPSKFENFKYVKKSILIFDVVPPRTRCISYLGIPYDFYTYNNVTKFVDDIIFAFEGFNIFIKHKRKYEKNVHDPRYINHIKNLESNKKISILNSEIGLKELSFGFDCAIGIPYTTPVLYTSQFIKSFYYDPTGCLEDIDMYSHKQKVLKSIDSLKEERINLIKKLNS